MTAPVRVPAPASAPSTAVRICAWERLIPDLGVAALVGDAQVAVFRLADDSLYAVQNLCPFSGASVMSRGITGSRGDDPTIASPVYKQVFSLVTGQCVATMDKQPLAGLSPDLRTYEAWVADGEVWIAPGRRT